MITLSNGGDNAYRLEQRPETVAVGTVDGVAILRRNGEAWTVDPRTLSGVFVSSLTVDPAGALYAGTHGSGVACTTDEGRSWTWPNAGVGHLDVWSIRSGKLADRNVVIAGTQPAHLYLTDDEGQSWRELAAMRDAPSREHWCFPPPPRIGHVKDVLIASGRLFAGIEIGALLVSDDAGATFTELVLDPDPRECDIHRVLVHPARPDRLIVANGLMGMLESTDRGATWTRLPLPPESNYPDAAAIHPDDPDLLFLAVGVGWPPHWYRLGRARGKIARSRDGGRTWERLLGGLPDGQRSLFSALTIATWPGGTEIFAVDTDGQVFMSADLGEHWCVIADVPPVSKGEFYRGLVRDRVVLSTVDDVIVNPVASARFAEAGV